MTKTAGNLLLVRDSLQAALEAGDQNGACANILAELGVSGLEPQLAMSLIKRRVDLDLTL
jgi:hypothetical protein